MTSIDDFTEVLLDEVTIQARVKELAHKITDDYKGQSLIMLTVMKGADNFSRDLRREMVSYSLKMYRDIVVDIIQDIVIMSMYEHPDRKKERPDKILGIGPHIPYENNNILHYSYPFYDLLPKTYNLIPNLGMSMMLHTILYAQENNKKYMYLGSASRPTDVYKLQFAGLEWFDGKVWQTDIEELKNILKPTNINI